MKKYVIDSVTEFYDELFSSFHIISGFYLTLQLFMHELLHITEGVTLGERDRMCIFFKNLDYEIMTAM
jgi:hypothetical protein